MTKKRVILELGAGTALHGGNYTKAAVRAVDDALHHSSLTFIKSLGLKAADMDVTVTIGVQQPDKVDKQAVAETLPHGKITVNVVHGGLDVPDDDGKDVTVIASAAIDVRMDLGR